MKNFTFKTEKATGRYRSFDNDMHLVKYNKFVVGTIADRKPFKIRLMVNKNAEELKEAPTCSWKWISLVYESTSLQEAKDYLKKNIELIKKTFTFPQEQS